jgi:2-iminobutanoate/2-iminopropanoate deaminase
VVSACGASIEDTLMARCYLTSMDLYAEFNHVYASYFPTRLPSRTCVAVSGLALGALVEVDVIVARPDSGASPP